MEYTVNEYKTENATVRVHKPVLTDEARAKRESIFFAALDRYMREYYRRTEAGREGSPADEK